MTDLAAWIAEKRAVAEATEKDDTLKRLNAAWLGRLSRENRNALACGVRHIAAFDPATTRRLLDAVEALAELVMQIEAPGYDLTPFAASRNRAKAALDALRVGDHG